MQEKKHIRTWPALLVVLLLVLMSVLVVGTANARLVRSVSDTLTLTYQKDDNQVYLLSANRTDQGDLLTDGSGNYLPPDGWQPLENVLGNPVDGYSLSFLLANGCRSHDIVAQNQLVSLEIFATLGIADPASMSIILDDGSSRYFAAPIAVNEGSAWYNVYGPGWVYRFYNSSGENMQWSLQGGVFDYREMTLTVSGSSQTPAVLSIIATAQPE